MARNIRKITMGRISIRMIAFASCLLIGSESFAQEIVGFTEPYQTIHLSALDSGTIANISVREGDVVASNQLLAVLHHDVLKVSLEIAAQGLNARGAIEAAHAEAKLRTTILEKLKELHSRGAASLEEVARAQTELEIANAHVLNAEESLEIKRLEHQRVLAEIEQRMIRSPIDGVVLEIHKKAGEFTSLPNPEVFTIAQLDPLLATFSVESHEIEQLKFDQRVKIQLENKTTAAGNIEFISPVTDAESGTVKVKVRVDNPGHKYRSGERCILIP